MGGNMEVVALDIPEVRILLAKHHNDERGFLSEVYNKRVLAAAGIDIGLRRGSPTFGKHVEAILSAEARNQMLVPIDFAGAWRPGG